MVALMPFSECGNPEHLVDGGGDPCGSSSSRTTARLSPWRCSRVSARNIGMYSEVSITPFQDRTDEPGSRPMASSARDALGGADHEECRRVGVRVPAVRGAAFADGLGEVDDRVAAHDQVVGRDAGIGAAADPRPRSGPSHSKSRAWPASRSAARMEEALHQALVDPTGVLGAERGPPGPGAHRRESMSVPTMRTGGGRDRLLGDRRQGERLGSVRGTSAPGANAAAARQLREDRVRQTLPLLGVAPSLRDVDRDAVEQRLELGRVAAQRGQQSGQAVRAAGARRRRAGVAPSAGACIG